MDFRLFKYLIWIFLVCHCDVISGQWVVTSTVQEIFVDGEGRQCGGCTNGQWVNEGTDTGAVQRGEDGCSYFTRTTKFRCNSSSARNDDSLRVCMLLRHFYHIRTACYRQWLEWEACSDECEGGVQRRYRFTSSEQFINEQRSCNNHQCPRWTGWENDGEGCRSTCSKLQVRQCIYQGRAVEIERCPPLESTANETNRWVPCAGGACVTTTPSTTTTTTTPPTTTTTTTRTTKATTLILTSRRAATTTKRTTTVPATNASILPTSAFFSEDVEVTVRASTQPPPSSNLTLIAVVVVIAVLVITAICVSCYVYRRRVTSQKLPETSSYSNVHFVSTSNDPPHKNDDVLYESIVDEIAYEATEFVSNEAQGPTYEEPNTIVTESVTAKVKDPTYVEPSAISTEYCRLNTALKNINFSHYNLPDHSLLQSYQSMREHDDKLFAEEFKDTLPEIVKARKVDFSVANLPQNFSKNWCKNILPSNEARVILKDVSNQSISNYINAAFIDGYDDYAKFIVTQHPTTTTEHDFWKMIVENHCSVIVMFSKTDKKYNNIHQQYWPELGQTKKFGKINIEGTGQSFYGKYCCTNLKITKYGSEKLLHVSHFNMIWEDIPSTTSSFLKLHKAAIKAQPSNSGPMVVHCRSGAGASAVFIAFDILTNQLKEEKQINVLETVFKLRLCRTEMVENLKQYVFLHQLLVDTQTFKEDTEVGVKEFYSYENGISRAKEESGRSEMEEQFSSLSRVPPFWYETSVASKPANRAMAKYPAMLPYDHNLAHISKTPGNKDIPYINASLVAAYTAQQYFVVAKDPIPQNTQLFWRCVIDNHVKYVVMIGDVNSCEKYWSEKDKPIIFDDVKVLTTNEMEFNGFKQRELELSNPNVKTYKVKQIVIEGWTKISLPSVSILLEVVKILEKCAEEVVKDSTRKDFIALIHCNDGSDQSGAFCAIYNLIEQIKNEKKVDVFRAVKDVRDVRMGAIGSFELFKLCYTTVQEFIKISQSNENA